MGKKWVIQIKRRSVISLYTLSIVTLVLSGCNSLDNSYTEVIDADGDGWSDVQEERAGTNPNEPDTDGDGYWDPKDANPLDPNIPSITQPATAPVPIPDETEAADIELTNIQTAVIAMMVDNQLSTLPNPVGVATNDMETFPDTTMAASRGNDPSGTAYSAADKDGFILYQHDITADGAQTGLVNYVATRYTKGTYTIDANGTVTQVTNLTMVPTPAPASAPPSPTTPVPLEPAHFVLAEPTITPTAVKMGEVVTISIAVSNTGGTEGSYTVVFNVKRVFPFSFTTFENVEVTFKAGQTKTVTFTTTKNETGTYTVDVHGKIGQFTVTVPPPMPKELEAKQVIEDLAYIKAFALAYTDDADPDKEGVDIKVSYYNSQSKSITPSDVSVEVTVELYWYTNQPAIYHKQVTIKYWAVEAWETPFPFYSSKVVRIPFEGIQEKPSGLTRGPVLILTVSTPNQGDFTIKEIIGWSHSWWP